MFQLNENEIDIMVSQNAILSRKNLVAHLHGFLPNKVLQIFQVS